MVLQCHAAHETQRGVTIKLHRETQRGVTVSFCTGGRISEVLQCHGRLSEVLQCHRRLSVVLQCHRRLSEVLQCHRRLSVVLHCHSARETGIDPDLAVANRACRSVGKNRHGTQALVKRIDCRHVRWLRRWIEGYWVGDTP